MGYRRLLLFLLLSFLVVPHQVFAHGGVEIGDDDLCLISIGFLQAHFTIFQPQTSGAKEFCEDIPQVTESVFVMKYEHNYLKEMPVDFRIIKNVTDVGFYAQWEDVEKLDSIDQHTVFYQAAGIHPEGVYTINHVFAEPGMYIGIVTAARPDDGKVYRAVFPFQVGGRDFGYLPFFIVLIITLQLGYWFINKKLNRSKA